MLKIFINDTLLLSTLITAYINNINTTTNINICIKGNFKSGTTILQQKKGWYWCALGIEKHRARHDCAKDMLYARHDCAKECETDFKDSTL